MSCRCVGACIRSCVCVYVAVDIEINLDVCFEVDASADALHYVLCLCFDCAHAYAHANMRVSVYVYANITAIGVSMSIQCCCKVRLRAGLHLGDCSGEGGWEYADRSCYDALFFGNLLVLLGSFCEAFKARRPLEPHEAPFKPKARCLVMSCGFPGSVLS